MIINLVIFDVSKPRRGGLLYHLCFREMIMMFEAILLGYINVEFLWH